jgi:two-component system, OmpR family, response regulator MprA
MVHTGMGRILVIEDEVRVADFVEKSLGEAGYSVQTAIDYQGGREAWKTSGADAVILDLMLPGGDGLDMLRELRAAGDQTPVLVLSAKASMSERVSGLDAGADDYLPKPFGIEELLARVRALLKRGKVTAPLVCDDLLIDVLARRVSRAGRVVFLSETEFRLVELLASRHGEPVSKKEILKSVWNDPDRDDNVVEVYVSYLRGKLEWRGAKRLVHTVRGRGYRLWESPDGP